MLYLYIHIFFNFRTNIIYILCFYYLYWYKKCTFNISVLHPKQPPQPPRFFSSRGWWSLAPLHRVGQLVGRSSRSWCSRSMCWILARIHVAKDEEIWLWKFLEKFLAKCLQCFVLFILLGERRLNLWWSGWCICNGVFRYVWISTSFVFYEF